MFILGDIFFKVELPFKIGEIHGRTLMADASGRHRWWRGMTKASFPRSLALLYVCSRQRSLSHKKLTRNRASTNMYSLTFRVRVMLP